MTTGSVTLGQLLDAGRDHIVIACGPCNRTGRYAVQRLAIIAAAMRSIAVTDGERQGFIGVKRKEAPPR